MVCHPNNGMPVSLFANSSNRSPQWTAQLICHLGTRVLNNRLPFERNLGNILNITLSARFTFLKLAGKFNPYYCSISSEYSFINETLSLTCHIFISSRSFSS